MPTLREITDKVNDNRETETALNFLEMDGVKEALLEAAGRGESQVSFDGWRGLEPCSTSVVHTDLGKVYVDFTEMFDDNEVGIEHIYVAW
jgi:hypothetical protein